MDIETYRETLLSVFARMFRDGLSLVRAVEEDGRMSRSTYYNLARDEPKLIEAAKSEAAEKVRAERDEIDAELAALLAQKRQAVQRKLLEEMEHNIETAVEVRDTAKSPFVQLQAAQVLSQWARDGLFGGPAKPPEDQKALPPRRSGLLSLPRGFQPQEVTARAADGTTVTVKAPAPNSIIEG